MNARYTRSCSLKILPWARCCPCTHPWPWLSPCQIAMQRCSMVSLAHCHTHTPTPRCCSRLSLDTDWVRGRSCRRGPVWRHGVAPPSSPPRHASRRLQAGHPLGAGALYRCWVFVFIFLYITNQEYYQTILKPIIYTICKLLCLICNFYIGFVSGYTQTDILRNTFLRHFKHPVRIYRNTMPHSP